MTDVSSKIDPSRLSHAYLITGSDAEGRLSAARYIANAAVCEGENKPCGVCRHCVKAQRGVHPDITVITRVEDERELKVDAMRAVRSAASVLPNEADRSVYIICDADTMNLQAQNAMLKSFEEPPRHAIFVLLAENPERLLPTVRSRCEALLLPPAEAEISASAREFFAALKSGGRALLAELVSIEKMPRTELPQFVSSLRRLAVDSLVDGDIGEELFNKINGACDTAEKYLALNVSAAHISGVFMAEVL